MDEYKLALICNTRGAAWCDTNSATIEESHEQRQPGRHIRHRLLPSWPCQTVASSLQAEWLKATVEPTSSNRNDTSNNYVNTFVNDENQMVSFRIPVYGRQVLLARLVAPCPGVQRRWRRRLGALAPERPRRPQHRPLVLLLHLPLLSQRHGTGQALQHRRDLPNSR